jgi:Protein of unknown function (DUF1761)
MDKMLTDVNWPAVIAGTVVAFALGMVWFGRIFGTIWRAGSHGIEAPASLPVTAVTIQLIGTFLMAWLIGATATANALGTALVAILAIAALQLAGSLFSQKSPGAALVDGGFVVAMGAVMILFQGLL